MSLFLPNITPAQRESSDKTVCKFIKKSTLLLVGCTWLVGVSYGLLSPKRYESQWVVLLPGTGSSTSINVDQLGQANTSSNSAYVNPTVDPRANYKAIATSTTVLAMAAKHMGIETSKYSAPKARLIDPTSLIEFKFVGSSALEARNRALALKTVMIKTTNDLRLDEMKQRKLSSQLSVASAYISLQKAQQQLSTFKKQGLISSDQVTSLITSNQQLTDDILNLDAERDNIKTQLLSLSNNLNTSPQALGVSYSLGADKVIQAYLTNYAAVANELSASNSTLNANHPVLINLKAKQYTLYNSIQDRANQIVGKPVSKLELNALLTIGANTNDGAANVYASVVDLQAQLAGLNAKAYQLRLKEQQSKAKLSQLSIQEPQLLDLERNVKLAEVLYNGVLGATNVNTADIYATYPLVQTLVDPTLSTTPFSPSWKIIIAGCSLTTIFIILASIVQTKNQ